MISKRAEKLEGNYIIESFVDTDGLWDSISVPENAIIFGRRGTGKTHLLRYLAEQRVKKKDFSVYIDLRTIGSNGGLYNDDNKKPAERVVTLIIDTLQSIYDEMIRLAMNIPADSRVDYSALMEGLSEFADAISRTRISGDVTLKSENSIQDKNSLTLSLEIEAEIKALKAKGQLSAELERIMSSSVSREESGNEEFHIIYPEINRAVRKINSSIKQHRIWLLIDEWAEIPQELQPYLADMMKKVFFPHQGFVVKIAAIENRSQFTKYSKSNQIIGIEPSADATSHLSLDEFMVFDNDEQKSQRFFENLIHKHAIAIDNSNTINRRVEKFVSQVFTQGNSMSEFTRASEGVARDALNIISDAALKAGNDKISVPLIRRAAKDCYMRGKKVSIENKDRASDLLNWIVDEVIKTRLAKAFMLEIGIKDPLIDFLFDNRVLHLIKQNVSAQDIRGKRFNVYSIDYGCYVDLINTTSAPKALLYDDDGQNITIPKSDYRSIRRSILDLNEFYASLDDHKAHNNPN